MVAPWIPIAGAQLVSGLGNYLGGRSARKGLKKARKGLAPYLEVGEEGAEGLSRFMQSPGEFERTPGYDFLLNEGLNAVDAQHAAQGSVGSGARDKDRMAYAQGVAAQEYGNQFNRLQNMANMGQQAAGAAAGYQAQAGQVGTDEAVNYGNLARGGLQDYLYWWMMQNQGGQGGGGLAGTGGSAFNPKPGMSQPLQY